MRVFVTGLCGTLGTALAELHHSRGDQVWGCARNEAACVRWLSVRQTVATLYVADAGDLAARRTDLARLLPTMERLYHCAALKHVDVCEAQPEEATYQNVVLTSQIAQACASAGVPMVFASTDKACLPSGVYGATKLIAERNVVRLGGAAVRLGNLVGSSGSVFERWRDAAARGEAVKLTAASMTRFFIGVREAAEFMADLHLPGRVVAPRMKAARMGDVADAVGGVVEQIGRRPGETLHQWLVGPEERVVVEEGRLVLDDEGGGRTAGLSSETCRDRWDVRELLALAGVEARA